MSLDPKRWFTEQAAGAGSAFSLAVRDKVFEQQSPYQKVEVYATEQWGNLMVIDGCTMLSTRDNFLYHEMMSHPALFALDAPRDVVIIGGGDCGTLREVLRHDSVQRATQIDIDEVVTQAAQRFFPELCEANDDPRAELLFIDGIQWIKDAAADSADLVIVDSTDPVGPAEGLFTEAFYRDCHRMLRDGGILIQQSESPLLHMEIIKGMYDAMFAAGYNDVKTIGFPQPVYPSGWWSATMARKNRQIDGFREADAAAMAKQTRYYNAEIHRTAFAMPNFFRQAIKVGR